MKKISVLVASMFMINNLLLPAVNAAVNNGYIINIEENTEYEDNSTTQVMETEKEFNTENNNQLDIMEDQDEVATDSDKLNESEETEYESTESEEVEYDSSEENSDIDKFEDNNEETDSTQNEDEFNEENSDIDEVEQNEDEDSDKLSNIPDSEENSNIESDEIIDLEENEDEYNQEGDSTLELLEDIKNYKIGDQYEVRKKPQIELYSHSVIESELLNKEEYRDDYEAAINREYLINKTESKFEIVLSHDEGGYTFLDESNTYDEAVAICNKFKEENKDETSIPTVIDEDGITVYSTNSMASFIKVVNGQIRYDQVTYLYENSNLTGNSNYINHNSIDDAPVIQDNGNAVQVLVNGYTGWVKKDTDSKNYDVIIVPMNKVTNPSYYSMINGELYHYISRDVSGTGGYNRSIGIAPSYMKANTKYYSYDGNYFYTNIDTLISDLKRNSKSNAVNHSNKYYNYYNYLPFRSRTNYTASEINKFISNNTTSNSKLRGIGQALINAQNTYGVNATLMLGVAINESGWGTSSIATSKNNIFGLNAIDSNPGLAANEFPSVEACINDFAKNYMSRGYTDPYDWRYYGGFLGNKNLGINVKYASDPFWGEKAAAYAMQLDKQMSNSSIANMKDYNYYQLAVFNSSTTVYSKNNSTLFVVNGDKYSANHEIIGVPVVVTNKNVTTNNGKKYTEIIPTRTSQLLLSGSGGKFNGNYDWNTNGYIEDSKLTMINTGKNMIENINGNVLYNSNIEGLGWQGWHNDGQLSGTEGQAKRLEAIKIQLKNYNNASIKYSVHLQSDGWQDWKSNGQVAGIENSGKRIEAIKIESSGLPENLQVQYRVHIQGIGWQDWKSDGQIAGTTGQALRIEAIEIKVAQRPDYVKYKSHIQSIGWQSEKTDNEISGTTGQAKRLEAINIQLINMPQGASIQYRTHIQSAGWEQQWKSNGQLSGTTGQAKRIEAIQIRLSGVPSGYHVEYRTHIEGIGWEKDWKRDGEISGTTGQAKRLEAIQIRIVKS